MIRIEKHLPAPHGLAQALIAKAPRLVLPFSERSKSRLRASLSSGGEAAVEVAIFLSRGTVLRGGDALMADDGSIVAVESAPERVLVVSAAHRLTLMRAAYHLGNRHVAVEVGDNYLKIEHDPVLADMLKRLGAEVVERQAVFEPEAGAYGGGHRHGHDATFDEDYALAQAAYRSHSQHSQVHANDDKHHEDEGSGHGAKHDHQSEHQHDHQRHHEHEHPHDHQHDHAASQPHHHNHPVSHPDHTASHPNLDLITRWTPDE